MLLLYWGNNKIRGKGKTVEIDGSLFVRRKRKERGFSGLSIRKQTIAFPLMLKVEVKGSYYHSIIPVLYRKQRISQLSERRINIHRRWATNIKLLNLVKMLSAA